MNRFFALFVLVLLLYPQGLCGEEGLKTVVVAEADIERIQNLKMLEASINAISAEIENYQLMLTGEQGLGREDVIRSTINELGTKRKKLETSFERLASDIDFRALKVNEDKVFQWNDELKELLGPLIGELKQITSRPREIEKIRGDILAYDNQIPVIRKAIANIDYLMLQKESWPVKKRLEANVRLWTNRLNELLTLREISSQQYERLLSEKKPVGESVQEFFRLFFKSRGRNLFVGVAALTLSFLLLNRLSKIIKKISPLHRAGREFYARIFDVSFSAFTVFVSVFVLFCTLYLFGDWVLLSVVILFVLGFLWASKQAVPKLWIQIRLMLNFGSVREGEVVAYGGIIYKVKSINLYSLLVNPYLDSAVLRVPIRDLADLRSRPVLDNEPWFPSKSGDWVVLNDGLYGKVLVQTPQCVRLVRQGGASVSYRVQDYISKNPVNLSSGFRLWVKLGLDYKYQSDMPDKIPEKLVKCLGESFSGAGYDKYVNSIGAELSEIGESSLDIEILADFKGSGDYRYEFFRRFINKACVDACNENEWLIPFGQLVVHMA